MPDDSVMSGRGRLDVRSLGIAFAVVLVLFVAAVLISYSTLSGRVAGGGGSLAAPLGDPDTPLFLAILLRNAAVALGLFAGVLTAGLGSLIGIAFLGFLVGASTAAAATEIGLAAALASVIGYAIIELPALLLAAAAGLVPASALLFPSRRLGELRPLARYLAPLPGSLLLLAIALVLIVVGAGVETAIISSRRI
ncbi:stage II sporulation protein M [Microbacterium sp. GCS4]|uniref:stage II sporulation protein M n=1 Tax=Microbacterium sp. GCS4 TaxID=1692239 RepID=UPI0019111395|nr:stage II sporulation protein M [Microbacterium sp. GCS4]